MDSDWQETEQARAMFHRVVRRALALMTREEIQSLKIGPEGAPESPQETVWSTALAETMNEDRLRAFQAGADPNVNEDWIARTGVERWRQRRATVN